MLDFFTNEDDMIENVGSIAPLGKSDHVGLLWTFVTYSAIDTIVGWLEARLLEAEVSAINTRLQKVKWSEEMKNNEGNSQVDSSNLQLKKKWEMLELLRSIYIKEGKDCGSDGIHTKLLKECAEILAKHLFLIVSKSLEVE